MGFNDDPTIIRIRALLKKAESAAKQGTPEGDNEANAYNEMAAKFIAKYGVDQALLAERGEIRDVITNKRTRITDNYSYDKRVLFNMIVKSLGGQVVFIQSRRPGTQQSYTLTAHVFAYETDMERMEFLFELLQPQMLLGAAAAQAPYWESARSFRKSWMSGFAAAIGERLKRTQKEAAAEAGAGTDLVLFDRSKAVKFDFDLAHDPKTITTQARSLNGSGRSQGFAAGQKASLGNAVGGGRRAIVG